MQQPLPSAILAGVDAVDAVDTEDVALKMLVGERANVIANVRAHAPAEVLAE